MKTPRPNPDESWEKLVRRARADVGPPADVAALLGVVRQAEIQAATGWRAEFVGLFPAGRAVTLCLAASCAVAVVTTWQVLDWWDALPWAQMMATATGGGL